MDLRKCTHACGRDDHWFPAGGPFAWRLNDGQPKMEYETESVTGKAVLSKL